MALTRCPWCMERLGEGGVCPRCSHVATTYIPATHHLPPGTLLRGRYVIGRALGEGGFGITYVGYDETLARRVAVKEYFPLGFATRYATSSLEVYSTAGGGDADFAAGRDKFLSEARVMAKMAGHDSLVGVTDYFQENGTAYIIMEYVEGESLGGYCDDRGGKIGFDELMSMLGGVFDGLSALHEAGLVHRDISPDNIMVSPTGARLIDFGCAREFVGDLGRERTMTVMLKYDYAAPEQYGRGGQGPWTDVYGLSATIYRCLTGTLPPRAMERLGGVPLTPASETGIVLPPAADEALARGLEPQASERYQSVQELRDAIEGKGPKGRKAAVPRKTQSRTGPNPLILIGAVVLIVAVTVAIVVAVAPKRQQEPVVDPTAETTDVSTEDSTDEPVDDAAIESTEDQTSGLTVEGVALAQTQLSAGDVHTVVVGTDDRIQSTRVKTSDKDFGQSDVDALGEAAVVAAGAFHTVAIGTDGQVRATGDDRYGQCDVEGWDVTNVACGCYHSVGLNADGTVVARGMNDSGQCDVDEWSDIVAIAAGDYHTVGLRADGTVVAVGLDKQGQCDVDDWTDIVAIAAGMAHTMGVRSDGTVVATTIVGGDQSIDCGQCDVGDWTDVVAVAAGRWHSIGLRSDGRLYACGSHYNGRCNVSGWQGARAICAGAEHTVALFADGTVRATGLRDDGQTDVSGMSWKAQ